MIEDTESIKIEDLESKHNRNLKVMIEDTESIKIEDLESKHILQETEGNDRGY